MMDAVRGMWLDYCAGNGLSADMPLPPVWHFCDNEQDADTCAELVVAKRKQATAPSLWGLIHRGDPAPRPGDLDIITTWAGAPRAIIRTTRVETHPFSAVTEAHAAAEGEGDLSLEWWRRVHGEYYARELASTPYAPSDDMPIVCQYFEIVHPGG